MGEPAPALGWELQHTEPVAEEVSARPDLRVLPGGVRDTPARVITDDMRRLLPPGAVGRIVDARTEIVMPGGAGAMLRRVVELGKLGVHVSTGSGCSTRYDGTAPSGPYTHGFQGY